MSQSAHGHWSRTRRLAIAATLVWALLVLVLPLAAPHIEVIAIKGIPLGYHASAQAIPIMLVLLAFLVAHRQRRIDNGREGFLPRIGPQRIRPWARPDGMSGLTGALGMAGDWLSGATLVTLVAALFVLGHDGLTWLLGLFAGIALGGMLIAPHLHRSQSECVIGFLSQRFGSVTGALALCVTAMAATLLLAANMQAMAAAASSLMPNVGREIVVSIAAVAFVASALRSSRPGLTLLQAMAYPTLAALLFMLVLLTPHGFTPAIFNYGAALQQISAQEIKLLEAEFADPVTLKAYLRPLTTATTSSALLLTLSLALGLAALPSVLARPIVARSHEGARLMPAAALLLIVAAAMALPPLAAKARLGLVTDVVGQSVNALPATVQALGDRGLITICGQPAQSRDALASACAALPDSPAALRLDDVAIPTDAVLLAAPHLAGLPAFAGDAVAIAVIVAAVLAAVWLGSALGNAARQLTTRPGAGSMLGALTASFVAVVAALLVIGRIVDVMTLVAWALALSASTLAPSLLLGIWWLRANAAGVIAGMIAGLAVALYYVVATRFFAPTFYETWSSLSSAGFGAIADYEAARDALATATDGPDRDAARVEYLTSARAVANWWGLRDIAVGALGAAVALVVAVLVSLVTPRPEVGALEVMARIRRPRPRV